MRDRRVIRELGLFNEHLEAQQAAGAFPMRPYQLGVPYPGYFLLDSGGIVIEKRFEQSYRVRDIAPALGAAFSTAPTDAVLARSDILTMRAWVDGGVYGPWQWVPLQVEIAIAPGLHVYAEPVPEGYQALNITIAGPPGVQVGAVQFPVALPMTVAGIDESFMMLEGIVQANIPVMVDKNASDIELAVTLRYQACSDTWCAPPNSIELGVPMRGVDLLRD